MISVVVASCRSAELLAEALDALLPQRLGAGAELIVSRPVDCDATPLALPDGCRVVDCPAGSTIPEIRGAGLAAASGEWVALTEDNCVVGERWLTELSAGFGGQALVVGGSMGNARPERAIDCGAAFAEYGFFGAGGEPGTLLLTGANVAYHRSVVAQVATLAQQGAWEDVIHGRLATQDITFRMMPAARVGQNLHYRLGTFSWDRYQHGRDYARVRGATLSLPKRLLLALATPLLPGLLAARIWRSAGRTDRRNFFRALPWTLTFLMAWAVGEAVGYLVPRHSR